MGVTNFVFKATGEKLYAVEVNAIYRAINNIEAAINITPGTPNAQIPNANIAPGIDASKLAPTSVASIAGLTLSGNLVSEGSAVFRGPVRLEGPSLLTVKNTANTEIIKLGLYDSANNYRGLVVTDGTNTNLLVDDSGSVTLRGVINALSGSTIVGNVYLEGGNFEGDVTVGGPNGITLRGSTSEIILNVNGKVIAGETILSNSGITINQGSINLGGKFIVDSTGKLTASDADISGKITATSGSIGGITISSSGISQGGFGPSTTGFSLSSDGFFYAKKGSFTGEIHAQSGTIDGDITVGGSISAPGVVINQTGLAITSGTINLGNGKFIVTGDGSLTATSANIVGSITATSGSFQGQVTAGDVTLSSTGITVAGASGITVTGSAGINITTGSINIGDRIKLGNYGTDTGILVTDGTNETFKVTSLGEVTVKGAIYGTSGSFTGEINATSGTFRNVSITGNITVAPDGQIIAGGSVLSSSGIYLNSGSINLANKFVVDQYGHLTAQDANITGSINATGGIFSGDITVGTGVSQIFIRGSYGDIIAGSSRIHGGGIDITSGSINIANQFIVDSYGNLSANSANITGSIVATSGHFEGPVFAGPAVRMDAEGIHVLGGSGIDVSGPEGIKIHAGSLVVKIEGTEPVNVIELGKYTLDGGITYDWGLLVKDISGPTLRISQDGSVFLKGEINATSGAFSGSVSVGDDIFINGSTGTITARDSQDWNRQVVIDHKGLRISTNAMSETPTWHYALTAEYIDGELLKSLSVDAEKIAPGAITGPKIADQAIDNMKIIAGTITEEKMRWNTHLLF